MGLIQQWPYPHLTEVKTEAQRGPLVSSLHSALVCSHKALCLFNKGTVTRMAQGPLASCWLASSACSPTSEWNRNVINLLSLSGDLRSPLTAEVLEAWSQGTVYVLPLSLLLLLGEVGVFPPVTNKTPPSIIFMDAWNSTIYGSFFQVEQLLPGTSFHLRNSSGMGY